MKQPIPEEEPIFQKSWNKSINSLDIVYPNLYYGGVYCLAPLIIYNIVNNQRNWICTRHFLDKNSLKSNFMGFTFQYEPDYYNFFKILEQNHIDKDKEKREQIIFAGGPCVNLNPNALKKYIDFFLIGECEESLIKILRVYEKTKDKSKFLKEIIKIPGVYIPDKNNSDKTDKNKIKIASVDLNKADYAIYQPFPKEIDKTFVFGKVFMLEIERGCVFNCNFCPINSFYEKTKYRSFENIKKIIDAGIKINKRNKVIIYSPSFTHPQRKEILEYLLSKNLDFSIPSIKIEMMNKEILNLIKKGNQKTLTIAPEANERIRFKICKFTKDDLIFRFIDDINEVGFKKLKCYFMIGLPDQQEKDLDEMLLLIKKIKEKFKGTIYVSINPFVPKPKTKFQDHKFDKSKVKKQALYIKKELNKIDIKYKIPNVNQSYLEWKLAFAEL
ncbi:MAG: radical SAM protein [archaeon]